MGMFDDVRCEMPLPGPKQPKHNSFQTKDFSCDLDLYAIKADGSLTFCGGPSEVERICPFHGMLNFYTYENDVMKQEGMWFEYEAKFTDGKCVRIECVEISHQRLGRPREPIYLRAEHATGAGPEVSE